MPNIHVEALSPRNEVIRLPGHTVVSIPSLSPVNDVRLVLSALGGVQRKLCSSTRLGACGCFQGLPEGIVYPIAGTTEPTVKG